MAAAVVVGVAAVDAWRHVDRPSRRPLAALPAVLAVHQLIEAFVWWGGGMILVVYVVATCGALLASRRPTIRWFGGVNLVAVALLAGLDQSALVSLWCAWAAVTGVLVAVHLRGVRRAGTLVVVDQVV